MYFDIQKPASFSTLLTRSPAMSNIKSGGIGIDITPSQEAAPCRFPKINRARLASFIEGEGGRALAPATIIWAQGNGTVRCPTLPCCRWLDPRTLEESNSIVQSG
jgi:hypothetical protein